MKITLLSLISILLIIIISCNSSINNNSIKRKDVKINRFVKSTLNDFIPKGFSILDSTHCDINLDESKDLILILKNNLKDSIMDGEVILRPCIILFGKNKNEYELYSRNDSIVLCFNCGGVFGDPYSGTETKKGEFTINHYGGSNWRWTNNLTFKYNSTDKKIYLESIEEASFNVLMVDDENENLDDYVQKNTEKQTKKDFGKVTFEKYSNNF